MPSAADVTRVLGELGQGEPSAAERLVPLIYDELRALAAHHLAGERRDHTLQPTALVHEAYLRLVDQTRTEFKNRVHFFAVAAEVIRRILVDHARTRGRQKRGGAAQRRERVGLESIETPDARPDPDLLALDEALEELGRVNERQRRIVEMRYFGGLTIEEAAEVLGIGPTTVKAEWKMARAWLAERLGR